MSSSYFGPGASRPIIRGFDGYRVRTLQDGIGTLDVSDSSPDHGVALEPLLIREITIHRGPGALLYGNSAIGGAVNATSRNFPEELPGDPLTGSLESRYDSAAEGKSAAGYAHLTVGETVFTLTGSARESEDYDIPGKARTAEYDRTFVPLVNVPGFGTVPVPNPSGTLPNTAHESTSYSVGASWMPEDLPITLGGAYSRFDSEYGIPYQYAGDPNDLFGFSSLSLRHERFDANARFEPGGGFLDTLHLHLGYADYSHTEKFDGRGKDADKAFDDTLFDQHALEARVEWFHRASESLEGVVGLHLQRQDLSASFLSAPPLATSRFGNRFETDNLGLFALETATVGDFVLQAGGRFESQTIRDRSLEEFGIVDDLRDRSSSFAVSLTWGRQGTGVFDEVALGPTISLVERIPTATERFAFWPNPAIQRFLIGGDKDERPLGTEKALGLEFGLEARSGPWSGRLSVYHYDYTDFIFLQDVTGPGNLAEYVDRDATFRGFEIELGWQRQLTSSGAVVTATVMSDYVRGQNETDDQPLPRIPPLRIGSRLEWEWKNLAAGLEYRHAFSQDRVQPETDTVLPELETDAYDEVNFDVAWDFDFRARTLTVFLRGTNLLDEERRIHTSFIKDVAPLPGRSFNLGARLSF